MLTVVGPRSGKRVTGLSVAIDTLCGGLEESGIPFLVIDTGGAAARPGAFSVQRSFSTIASMTKFYASLIRSRGVYIPIALTRLGFIRDALMIWVAWLARRRIVLQLHGGGFDSFHRSLSWPIQHLVRATLRCADSIVVPVEDMRKDFSFIGDAGVRVEVVPYGLSVDKVGTRQASGKRLRGQPMRILYLSNMIESKGYLDVLEACRLLRDRHAIPFSCAFCGDFVRTVMDPADSTEDAARQHFLDKIASTGLAGQVSYRTSVLGEEKWKLLLGADVFVLPSYYPWEAMPLSIIEALACGLPVVATRHRGIPELVVDGHNGVLVERQSPRQIADAIAALYADPDRWALLGENAYRRYRQRFTREAHLARLIPIVVGGRKLAESSPRS